jgi:hypothetical protein
MATVRHNLSSAPRRLPFGILFRRLVPVWGLGTVYWVFDTDKKQLSIRFMPWKKFPRFTLAKKKATFDGPCAAKRSRRQRRRRARRNI